MALYIGDKKYAVTKALYRGFYMVVVHGFAGTTVTCAGTTLYIGSNESVIFKIVDPGTYTFVATRKGETKTETLVLDPKTSQYSYNIGMYLGMQLVEYLESSGTQYIDTGIFAEPDCKIEIEYELTSIDDTINCSPYGAWTTDGEPNIRHLYGRLNYLLNNDSQPPYMNGPTMSTGVRYIETVDASGWNINGTTYTNTNQRTQTTTETIKIYHRTDNHEYVSMSGRVYSVKIWNGGVLVQDLVPVLDNTLQGCFYDRVSQQMYYNAGTGEFITGPSMAFDELVYIESTGTQWIDTEVHNAGGNIIDATLKPLSNDGYLYYYVGTVGSTPDNSRNLVNISRNSGNNYYRFQKMTVVQDSDVVVTNNIVNIKIDTTGTDLLGYINGTLKVNRSNVGTLGTPSRNICIGRDEYSNTNIIQQVYGVKIYDNAGVLVRDLIPVKRKTGEVCMWDKVEEKFYYNKGTGNFIDGPVKSYTELEYLESTGTQYIDTGVIPNETTDIEILVGRNTTMTGSGNGIFGNDNVGGRWSELNGFRSGFGTSAWTTSTVTQSDINTISFNKTNPTFNGTSLSISRGTEYGSENLYIFRISSSDSYSSTKVYSMKIYNGSTLVRDFIPVKRSDDVVGILDKVNNKFYWNMGTGEFIGGPEINHTELEWIQSNTDGEQYIDTGIVPNANQQIDITYQKEDDEYVMIFGSRQAWDSSMSTLSNVSVSDDVTRIVWGNSELYVTIPFITDKVTFSISDGSILKDGVRVSTSSYGSSYYNGPMYLFSVNNGGTPMSGQYCRNTKIYSFSVYNNGNLIQDLVPVKRNTDDVICMFDKVTRRYYTNAGTGAFIAGPVKSN